MLWERPLSVRDVMGTPLRTQIPVLRWICRVTFLLGTKMPNPHQSSGHVRKTGKHMNHFKAKVTQNLDRTAVERREQRSGPAMAAGSSAHLEAPESGLLCPLRVLGPPGEVPWKIALSVSSPPPVSLLGGGLSHSFSWREGASQIVFPRSPQDHLD